MSFFGRIKSEAGTYLHMELAKSSAALNKKLVKKIISILWVVTFLVKLFLLLLECSVIQHIQIITFFVREREGQIHQIEKKKILRIFSVPFRNVFLERRYFFVQLCLVHGYFARVQISSHPPFTPFTPSRQRVIDWLQPELHIRRKKET